MPKWRQLFRTLSAARRIERVRLVKRGLKGASAVGASQVDSLPANHPFGWSRTTVQWLKSAKAASPRRHTGQELAMKQSGSRSVLREFLKKRPTHLCTLFQRPLDYLTCEFVHISPVS